MWEEIQNNIILRWPSNSGKIFHGSIKAEKSDSKRCRTFLSPMHTLDIASSNAAVSYYGLPSPVVLTAAGNPWTFPRPRNHATGMVSTLAALGPGFQVQCRISKKSVDKNRQTFLAGALGLELP